MWVLILAVLALVATFPVGSGGVDTPSGCAHDKWIFCDDGGGAE